MSLRLLRANGLRLSIADWARRLGIHPRTITARLRRGWPVDRAVSTPPRKYQRPD